MVGLSANLEVGEQSLAGCGVYFSSQPRRLACKATKQNPQLEDVEIRGMGYIDEICVAGTLSSPRKESVQWKMSSPLEVTNFDTYYSCCSF